MQWTEEVIKFLNKPEVSALLTSWFFSAFGGLAKFVVDNVLVDFSQRQEIENAVSTKMNGWLLVASIFVAVFSGTVVHYLLGDNISSGIRNSAILMAGYASRRTLSVLDKRYADEIETRSKKNIPS